MEKRIVILGSEWVVEYVEMGDAEMDGETDYTDRTIRIRTDNVFEVGDFVQLQNKQLRHEVIHAFMAESGLQSNFEHYQKYGHEETTVDWFAIQFPKILRVYTELGCI